MVTILEAKLYIRILLPLKSSYKHQYTLILVLLKQHKLLLLATVAALAILTGCASIRASRLGKFYNNLTARYNGYFNARELVKASEKTVQAAHVEDFTRILDVYRWGDVNTGKSQASDMDKAIEKCSKVIQNHEGSNWIDDAYFCVARAYFFKADYYAALDLFKYLAIEYEGSEMELQARLWIVKTYLQMGKIDDAQAYLANIQNDRKKFIKLQKEVDLLNAHLKIKARNYTDAIVSLERAIPEESKRKDKNRYIFILAQLYETQNNNRKANELYSELLNKSMPYEFQFQTRLKVAKSSNLHNKSSVDRVIKSFEKLLKDDNNREYFDQIHYEIAQVYEEFGDKAQAAQHYKISAWLGEKNLTQRANTYLALGDMYFEDDYFELAGHYYDSCASIVPENHPKYDQIQKQQQILGKLITNLQTIKTQDSLLELSTKEPKEIDKLVDQQMAKEEAAQKKAAEMAEKKKMREEIRGKMNESSIANAPNMINSSGQWYFYNPVAIGKGNTDFVVEWGRRPLEDNWRRSQKAAVFVDNSAEDSTVAPVGKDSSSVIDSMPTEELSADLTDMLKNLNEQKLAYFSRIPFLPAQKRAAESLVQEALYENGLIYYEQLKDLNSAIENFERLLEKYPGNKFEPAANYYLYKIYNDLNQSEKAEAYKDYILTKFPNSQYAALLNGKKNMADVEADPMVERLYELAYNYYKTNDCDSVTSTYLLATKQTNDNYLHDKFEFLQTLCKGKKQPVDSFITSLQLFVDIYPKSESAKEARNLIRYLKEHKPKEKATEGEGGTDSTSTELTKKPAKEFPFKYSESGEFYFIIASTQKDLRTEKVKSEIANYNVAYHRSEALSVRSLEFGDGEMLFWVKTFPNIDRAKTYYSGILNDEDFMAASGMDSPSVFYISAENFKLLISEQNTNEYIEFFDWYFVKKEN
ncbi:tetratricopeptide repeat protein [bacterium]|nr:tetratricopeptide repeat protein [bacterium]